MHAQSVKLQRRKQVKISMYGYIIAQQVNHIAMPDNDSSKKKLIMAFTEPRSRPVFQNNK